MLTLEPGAVHRVLCPETGERALLDAIPMWAPDGPDTLLLVPSKSVRRHWLRRITREKGAILGVQVLTHNQLVGTLVDSGPLEKQRSALWARQVSMNAASEQPILQRTLGDMEDGLRMAALTIEELVESGVRAEHVDAMVDCVQSWTSQKGSDLPGGVAPRVLSVLRATEQALNQLDEQGYCWPAQTIDAVSARLHSDPVTWLKACRIFILAYADATCAVGDLINTLRVGYGATVLMPTPPSPTEVGVPDSGHVYAQSFTERFSEAWGADIGEARTPNIMVREAQDPVAEVSVVAQHISALIEEGVDPSEIGVVARTLVPWVDTIGPVFHDYGVPFSGIGATSVGDKAHRSLVALSDCIRRGADADAGRWLQSVGYEDETDLLLLFDCLRARRVRDVAPNLGGNQGGYVLPYRLGLFDDPDRNQARFHTVSQRSRDKIVELARRWCGIWNAWPDRAPVYIHLEAARQLFREVDVGDENASPGDAIERLNDSLPLDASLTRPDFVAMLASELAESGLQPVGGQGGGIRVLDAMEARGLSFSHLFVLGMNRGAFPRTVNEDPILPDWCRRELQRLVPDLRENALGNEEERFLFAQLLSASPTVTLSYSRVDLGNKAQHPSSLIINLALHGTTGPLEIGEMDEMPSWKRATLETIHNPERFESLECVPAYLRQHAKGANRNTIFLGDIGPAVHPNDPRQKDLYVTTIEAIAQCPWKAFLTRDLGLPRRPNPSGPLPKLSSHLIGRVVHAVIERAVNACTAESSPGEPVEMRWPSWSTIDQWTNEAAVQLLASDGVPWLGFGAACVPGVREVIQELKEVDGDATKVVGGEISGEWQTPTLGTVRFRIDRVDDVGGRGCLTDFKLGKPPTTHRTDASRRAKILESVREGRLLQGPVYALSSPNKMGRYLFLNGGGTYPQREFGFEAEDEEIIGAVEAIAQEVGKARSAGHMFPRVSEANRDKMPAACAHCMVKEACPVMESGSRLSVIRRASESRPVDSAWGALWWRGKFHE